MGRFVMGRFVCAPASQMVLKWPGLGRGRWGGGWKDKGQRDELTYIQVLGIIQLLHLLLTDFL
jgi:hypothetical protein